jgi:predicted O-methyltransferase YrrM
VERPGSARPCVPRRHAGGPRARQGGVLLPRLAEYEPAKVKGARANFEAAGLAAFIELHEGDLIEAFKKVEGPIDFVLFDVWGDVVRPALDLLSPHLRPGAVICADNTAGERGRQGYAPFFEAVADPAYGLRTMTLPFEGGFEMTVKVG